MSQRYFEDINVGDELPPVEKLPTEELCVKFFTREGKPPPTPERIPVPREGFSGTIVPGMLKVSWLSKYVTDWAGPGSAFRTIRVSYKRPDTTGVPLTLAGRVVDKREEEAGNVVEVETVMLNDGQPSVMGSVQVLLPKREGS